MACGLKRGFTLVEIMVVVVVIGLLAAMAIPSFSRVRETSQAKTCINNLRQIASAKERYFFQNGGEETVALATLIGADGYIKAAPICPAGGEYSDPLLIDAEPACETEDGEHLLSILRHLGL